MLARILDVIYWGFCVLAALWLAYFLSFLVEDRSHWMDVLSAGLIGAALIWLVGRAIRYVLTGK